MACSCVVDPTAMLVEFYAPWCIHCQQMTSAWRKAALLLDDLVTVGAVNCERQKTLCQRTNIQGYPSVFLYPAGHPNQSPEPFESHHHSADEIVSFVKQIVRPSTKAIEEWNFARTVLESTRPWLVVFKTPWCACVLCHAMSPRQILLTAHVALRRWTVQADPANTASFRSDSRGGGQRWDCGLRAVAAAVPRSASAVLPGTETIPSIR